MQQTTCALSSLPHKPKTKMRSRFYYVMHWCFGKDFLKDSIFIFRVLFIIKKNTSFKKINLVLVANCNRTAPLMCRALVQQPCDGDKTDDPFDFMK